MTTTSDRTNQPAIDSRFLTGSTVVHVPGTAGYFQASSSSSGGAEPRVAGAPAESMRWSGRVRVRMSSRARMPRRAARDDDRERKHARKHE